MGIVVASATGHVDPVAFQRYLNDEHGPVRTDLRRRGLRAQAGVVRRCPRKTGLLVSTVRSSTGLDGEKPYVEITAGRDGKTNYLGYLLYGTHDHDVFPHDNRPNPHLRFVYNGFVIFAKKTHPSGIAANNFLAKALDDASG